MHTIKKKGETDLKVIKWIKQGEFGKDNNDSDQLITEIEKYLNSIKNTITSTKLREYFEEIKKLYEISELKKEGELKLKAYLILSKMRYDQGRQKKNKIEDYKRFVDDFELMLEELFNEYSIKKLEVVKIWFETLVSVGKTILK